MTWNIFWVFPATGLFFGGVILIILVSIRVIVLLKIFSALARAFGALGK